MKIDLNFVGWCIVSLGLWWLIYQAALWVWLP